MLYTGSDEYEKLVASLSKTSLLHGIKNASPIAQTSCLEGYHSVVNQFAPKMLAYSRTGILCRSVITLLIVLIISWGGGGLLMVPGKIQWILHNFRTILAAIHFNYNICRKSKVDMHGNVKLKVTYPKFKEGEATVKEVKVVPNYGKVFLYKSVQNEKHYNFLVFSPSLEQFHRVCNCLMYCKMP